MNESKRNETYLCSELVSLEWLSQFGRRRTAVANLEEIGSRRAVLQCDGPMKPGTRLVIHTLNLKLRAMVRSSTADFIGYFVEVDFLEGFRWTPRVFAPLHMLDPHTVPSSKLKQRNNQLLAECSRRLLEIPG